MVPVLGKDLTGMYTAAQYSWFIGCGLGFAVYYLLATRTSLAVRNASSPDTVTVD
jgi:NCS1 family nucleobase:cation symporter-1